MPTEVILLRWPDEATHGASLAEQGVAVLYLVGPNDEPPIPLTCLEDWVRVPGDDRDLNARAATLELRLRAHDAPPRVDHQGRLHYRDTLLPLAPEKARLIDLLISRFGDVVSDRELSATVVQGGPSDLAQSLRAHMSQLRKQLRDTGLALHRIRRRGYKLESR